MFEKKTIASVGMIFGLACGGAAAHADTILFEDFEDSTLTYTTNVADSLNNIANKDYFGRIDAGSGLPADVEYLNKQGGGFYGAQDTDGSTPFSTDLVVLNWTGIDISNFTGLSLSWFVAEDDASDGNEDWDIDTSVRLDAQIDGGGFASIFAIEGASNVVGNRSPRVDTNFDGVGDGAEITNTFTQFSALIGDGAVLDIRLTIKDLDTSDEDIAFDNLRVEGTFDSAAVPLPAPLALMVPSLALIGFAGWRRQKRAAI